VVYGTGWCAQTQRVRRYLDRLGVPYDFRDMDEDQEAARRVQWWTGGTLSHPTVQIGGQVLVEPSLEEVDWALTRAGII
jgi:mycoredoxin